MQENVRKYLAKLKENRKLNRRKQFVMLVACLVVISGVFGMLIVPGLGEEAELTLICEKAEHTHDNTSCWGVTCTQEVHEQHGDECKTLVCTIEEGHVHTVDACGITYTCEKEGTVETIDGVEITHEHTDECSFDYSCGEVEAHEHADECDTLNCDKEIHSHVAESCEGYVCGYTEEHTHGEECYETVDDLSGVPALLSEEGDDNNSGDNTNEVINEGLVLGFDVSTQTTTSGSVHTVGLYSNYSKANNTGNSAVVTIDVSGLPDGISPYGFQNGEKTYTYTFSGELGDVEQQITLKYNGSSITYEQPQGSTLDIDLQFVSQNGITESGATVTLNIDPDKITGLEEGTSISCPDGFYTTSSMTWTAGFSWDPVVKKVNYLDENTIAVTGDNTLSGDLIYTITAISKNNENFGEIWTKEVSVTDTLTLPGNISLPSGAKVEGDKIVIEQDGEIEEILSFKDLPTGTTVSLTLSNNRKTISYSLVVPNTHVENSVPTKEQDNLNLTMVLHTELLELAEGYNEQDAGEVTADKITNAVSIQPYPYKGDPGAETADAVATVPVIPAEEWILEKATTNTEGVQAGEEIEYTLTLKNTGEKPIKVVKDATTTPVTYYTVTDKLPAQLYLTSEQISNLPSGVTYDSLSNTITWEPSKTSIPCGTEKKITFNTQVKAIDDPTIENLKNGNKISNIAYFKEKPSEAVDIEYLKAYLTIKKASTTEEKDTSVHDGEKVTYTVTVNNDTKLDYPSEETVTDILPAGLILGKVYVGDTELAVVNGSATCDLHAADTGCKKEHKVKFTVEDQKLSWNIGKLAAGESVVLKYECTVDMKAVTSKNGELSNTAKVTDGSTTNIVGIDYPITLIKGVDADVTKEYASGHIFDYTITVENDEKYPSKKNNLQLVDTMPKGLLPYPEENGDGTLYIMQGEIADPNADAVREWSKFANGEYTDANATYYTNIDGKQVKVTLSNANEVVLTWDLGELAPGTLEITYKAQMILTAEQINEGKAYRFTNKATIDGFSSSVTVIGGQKVGSIKLKKVFYKEENGTYDQLSIEDLPDKGSNIVFELTGVDSEKQDIVFEDGKTIKEVELSKFTTGDNKTFEYTIEKLPIGKYTIIEKNYTPLDDCGGATYYESLNKWGGFSYTNGMEIVDVGENAVIEIKVYNMSLPHETVNLQKSVYEIGKGLKENTTWDALPEKYVFTVNDADRIKTYVVYNITLSVLGGDYASIDSVVDRLPEGLKYVGLYNSKDYAKNATAFKDVITTTETPNFNNAASVEQGLKFIKNYTVEKTSYDEESNTVELSIKNSSGRGLISAGYAISFAMLCEVESDKVIADKELTNTVELTISGAEYVSDKSYNMINTAYDANQNNGKAALESENEETGQKMISSAVSVLPKNTVVPGIEKEAVSYLLGNQFVELGEYSNIDPNSVVKWEITIHNDGTQSLQDYRIEDVVTAPFHLITPEEATSVGITEPYEYRIGTSETYGTVWWRDISSTDMANLAAGIENGEKLSEYTFNFEGSNYSIPAGGCAVLTLYTYNTEGGKNIYTNTATIYPTQEITAIDVEYGELVKDNSTGQYIGVKASDQVYALGEYASASWKTITETDDANNTARGTWSKNYIVVDDVTKEVTYTNNIRNISSNGFNKLVMIDLMPMINDTGVVNRNDRRGSEFEVHYGEKLVLNVVNASGNVADLTGRNFTYTIQFSNKTSFTQSDFNGDESSRWHDTYQDGDCSFRIIMNPDFELKSQETLVVQYAGQIDDGAVPGSIAWNSFGYQYYLTSEPDKFLRAEPPKVGVMIPTAPIIQKEVIDAEGNELEKDPEVLFTFALYEKGIDTSGVPREIYLCEFELCQGGYSYLTELKDTNGNTIKLENGKEYVIKELTDEAHMPKGYTMIGIGENNGALAESYSFTYYETKNINILARNQVEEYVSELPATGSFSAMAYKAGGALLVLLAGLVCGWQLIIRRKQRMVK